jgi:hypothetical protein
VYTVLKRVKGDEDVEVYYHKMTMHKRIKQRKREDVGTSTEFQFKSKNKTLKFTKVKNSQANRERQIDPVLPSLS